MRAEPPVFFAAPDFDAVERVEALAPDDLAAAGFFAVDDFAVEARDDDLAPPAFAPPAFAPPDFAAVERVDFAAGFAAAFAPPDFAAVERVDFAAAGFAAAFAPDDFAPVERDEAFAPEDLDADDLLPPDFEADDLEPLFLVAIFSNSFSLIDAAIGFDAPRSLLLGLSPRLADRLHRLA